MILTRYAMEAAAWEPIDPDTDSDASAHGYFRWHQGYDLSEVLHELSLLRAIVLEVLVTHPEVTDRRMLLPLPGAGARGRR